MIARRAFLLLLLGPPLAAAQPATPQRPAVSYWRNGPLLFLGTSHTNSVDDPQIPEIRHHIASFDADIVLVEGGTWPGFQNPTEAIASFGELAYAASVARSLGRRVEDADPSIVSEHAHTLSVHGADRTRLYYVLRMVPQFTRAAEVGGPSVDRAMIAWMSSTNLADLADTSISLTSLDRLQELCARELPALGDWRNAADGRWWSTRTPTPETFLQTVQATALAFRDQHIANRIAMELTGGKRVLVVAGKSHLTAACGRRPHARLPGCGRAANRVDAAAVKRRGGRPRREPENAGPAVGRARSAGCRTQKQYVK